MKQSEYPYLTKISYNKIKLDLKNPRLPKSKQGDDKTEQDAIDFLLLEAATLELMIAIGKNNFFQGEVLLVNDHKDGTFTVVEGNRRLTAVKLLHNPNLARVKKMSVKAAVDEADYFPTDLPCLVFGEKRNIQKYLGFRHITGVKSWRLLEKARYLSDLYKSEFSNTSLSQACIELAKMIGSRSDYVKKLLISYQLYEIVSEEHGFYGINGLNDTNFFLNYYKDALNKENIRSFLNINLDSEEPLTNFSQDNLMQLSKWWFEKHEGKSRVLGDSEGLKMLDKVIGSNQAFKAFAEEGVSISDAFEMTGELDIQFKKRVLEALDSMENADRLSNKISTFYSGLYEDLKAIRRIALKINEYREQVKKEGNDF